METHWSAHPLVKRNQPEAWRYAIRFASSQSAGWERKGAYKDRKADGYLVLFPKLLLSLAFSVKRVLPLVALLPVSFCELLVCCLLLVLEFKSPVVSKHDQGPVHTVICHTNAYRHIVCNLVHFEDKGFTRTFGYIMIARVESRLICLVVENSLWEVIWILLLSSKPGPKQVLPTEQKTQTSSTHLFSSKAPVWDYSYKVGKYLPMSKYFDSKKQVVDQQSLQKEQANVVFEVLGSRVTCSKFQSVEWMDNLSQACILR